MRLLDWVVARGGLREAGEIWLSGAHILSHSYLALLVQLEGLLVLVDGLCREVG